MRDGRRLLCRSTAVTAREDHAKRRSMAGFRREFHPGIEKLTESLDDRQTDALSRLLALR